MMNTNGQEKLTYAYYPGCSLHATAREFDASLRAVCAALGIDLRDIDGWSCCGASSAHALSHNLAVGLAARNLALIERTGLEAIAPCAACFNRLRSAQAELEDHPAAYGWLQQALDTPLYGTARLRSLLHVFLQDMGTERIAARVRRPLNRLRPVGYFGCLLARPAAISELGDPEHPGELDDLMRCLGAAPVDWSFAVDCCGGSLSIARPALVRRMTQTIVEGARAAGANLIVTACPMCQVNLEMRQAAGSAARMPALYFTEVMGLAFNLPGTTAWWRQHLVDPRPLLASIGRGR